MRSKKVKLEKTDKIYKMSKNLYSINGEFFFSIRNSKKTGYKCMDCSLKPDKCILYNGLNKPTLDYAMCFILRSMCDRNMSSLNSYIYIHSDNSLFINSIKRKFRNGRYEDIREEYKPY